MTPIDKENVNNILDMFGDKYPREFVQRILLDNDRNFERTLDMFLTENLPPVDAKP